ncbi:hypothetical protein FHU38_001400 [Saccharomonospora amisosensis]|uniref:Aminoglycoside phosphotransferase domain-containing protein n=1 Tax=Saccharomonospora amisosensis TaxID=1128677 RepID=A0A7X5UN34_9PSEU|nr:aminoglycoside phosphotransferase family protein [Saccharomonospora amisosensis]NIJ11056.1 hypothetical protein [Saccharomonospora amisosensis]
MTHTAASFTPESTRAALESACGTLGLDPCGAELVRMGENAMYRLPGVGVMVRIGRSVAAIRKEVDVARWLANHRFPAARLADGFEQPLTVMGFPVSFWEYIHESTEPVDLADLGCILRSLHDLPPSRTFTLPAFSPMPKVRARLDSMRVSEVVTTEDFDFLYRRYEELEQSFTLLDFSLPQGPIHGDAHNGNLLRDASSGVVRLIDFEDFAWGPREWDAAVAAVRHSVFGWVERDEYSKYVASYGWDALTWDGFPVLRAIRELNMTTWLMQLVGQSAEIDAEVRQRLCDLRDYDSPRNWGAF